jgi:flagellar assembly factor FliW
MTEVAMLSSHQAPPQPAPAADLPASLATRFGEVRLDGDRLITFPAGLLGFADCRRYVLADLPDRQVALKLLQSIDQPELAFLVLPLDLAEGPIGHGDLQQACDELGLEWSTLVALAIVTIRQDDGGVGFSINLRAPLLIDSRRQLGRQHVFAGDAYPLRHDLARADAA